MDPGAGHTARPYCRTRRRAPSRLSGGRAKKTSVRESCRELLPLTPLTLVGHVLTVVLPEDDKTCNNLPASARSAGFFVDIRSSTEKI
jgi:hypothetical protein